MSKRQKPSNARSKSYEVGYGLPPKKFQFRKGRSGNPTGTRRKPPPLASDLKVSLERALNARVKLRRGERDEIVTKAAAGIDKLVNQFAEGDRHARRDLIALAETLGVDLTAGQGRTIEHVVTEALAAEDEAVIADFLRRQLNQGDENAGSVSDQADAENSNESKENSHDHA
jgi:hypothetical protein